MLKTRATRPTSSLGASRPTTVEAESGMLGSTKLEGAEAHAPWPNPPSTEHSPLHRD
jgi:hypothetical protein